MRQNNITKGLLISGLGYGIIKLIESLVQFSILIVAEISVSMMNYLVIIGYVLMIVRPILLIVFIVFGYKALVIILKSCLILIDKNKES